MTLMPPHSGFASTTNASAQMMNNQTQNRRKTPQINNNSVQLNGHLQQIYSNTPIQQKQQQPNSGGGYVSSYTNNMQWLKQNGGGAPNPNNYQNYAQQNVNMTGMIDNIDSSYIDMDNEADMSNNTISNLNQQLGS